LNSAFSLAVESNGLGTLTFDQPDKSVNIFTRETLTELEATVTALASRDDIRVLVLRSAKPKTFIAGADVELIAGLTDPVEAEAGARQGQALFSAWAALPFPTIAAIRGTCVGGGTELALASSAILLSDRDDIRVGLPEIKLGILPAWGGCSRLPRRIGIAAALDIILAGRTVRPRKAYRLRLADALLPDAQFDRLVRKLALQQIDHTLRRDRKTDLKDLLLEHNPIGRKLLFDQARKRTLKKTGGQYPAPLRALEVIRVGAEHGLTAGLDAEARAVSELATSATCKNLIHVFRMMEEAKQVGAFDPGEAPVIRGVGVLGAGVMGGGIAQLVAAKADVPVRMKDVGMKPLEHGMAHAASLFRKQVDRRRLSAPDAQRQLGLLRPTLDYSGFKGCDLVIEAIVENLAIKQKVFAEVAEHVADSTLLASNTSSLSIDAIGSQTPGRERVVGMHFFNPVDRMPLVEVIAAPATRDEATRAVAWFARRLGKTPVIVKDSPGFLVNRLLMFYATESLWLLQEGHSIESLDRAMTAWGMPMGPLALTDEVGIDVAVKVAHILTDAFGDRLPVPDWLEKALDDDRLGRKNGRGFYHYENGKRGAPDETIYDLLGVARHQVRSDPARLADRMVLRMVDEAARCLEEGVVDGPATLDLALIMGTGFPPFRGGLCRWADTQNLGELIAQLERLSGSVAPRFEPSPALRAAADSGGFYAHSWSA
jgi:3-hydroxyacyl-CoA dehydrogenase/enoyl-CoA hydratase/3-hydroxybutyryl-CoA epimerase